VHAAVLRSSTHRVEAHAAVLGVAGVSNEWKAQADAGAAVPLRGAGGVAEPPTMDYPYEGRIRIRIPVKMYRRGSFCFG
jgi:hypothetical protein